MKTPMQEVFAHLRASKESDGFGEVYCVDWLLENEKFMLEKEKEVMCAFADECAIECFNFHHEKTMSSEQVFNLTFNTKEEWKKHQYNS